jgi:hypothetical protein
VSSLIEATIPTGRSFSLSLRAPAWAVNTRRTRPPAPVFFFFELDLGRSLEPLAHLHAHHSSLDLHAWPWKLETWLVCLLQLKRGFVEIGHFIIIYYFFFCTCLVSSYSVGDSSACSSWKHGL